MEDWHEPREHRNGRTAGDDPALLPARAKRRPLNLPAIDTADEDVAPGDVPGALLPLDSYFAGRYRVLRLIGLGGMSEVYEAWDIEGERAAALKILRLQHRRSDKLRLQMAAEARALIELKHPNVVAVSDAGATEEGLLYFAMELLDGATLLEAIYGSPETPRTRPVPLRAALDWMRQLAGAVHALHLAGIVHRDLKPENVFVTRDGKIKVLDLGAAKFRRYGLRTTGAHKTIGTPPYMSPEHLRGDPSIDGRADVYSLGHVFYETIAGQHAFCGPGEAYSGETYRLWQEQRRPESLTARRPGLPAIVSDVVLKALEKRREDRWQSCEEMMFAAIGVADHLQSQGLLDEPAEVPAEVAAARRLAAATTDEAVAGRLAEPPVVRVHPAEIVQPAAGVQAATDSRAPMAKPVRRTARGTEILEGGAARPDVPGAPAVPASAAPEPAALAASTAAPRAPASTTLEVVTTEPRASFESPTKRAGASRGEGRRRSRWGSAVVLGVVLVFASAGALGVYIARTVRPSGAPVAASPAAFSSVPAPLSSSADVPPAAEPRSSSPAADMPARADPVASATVPDEPRTKSEPAMKPASRPAGARAMTPSATPPAAASATVSVSPKSARVEDGPKSILPFGKGE